MSYIERLTEIPDSDKARFANSAPLLALLQCDEAGNQMPDITVVEKIQLLCPQARLRSNALVVDDVRRTPSYSDASSTSSASGSPGAASRFLGRTQSEPTPGIASGSADVSARAATRMGL